MPSVFVFFPSPSISNTTLTYISIM
jgi:hypothetical protein